MKKLLLILTLTLSTTISFSQSFIDFGPKLLVGPNALMNSDIMGGNDKYTLNPASFGMGGGFKLAFDINESVAVVGEFIYLSHKQKYTMTDTIGGEQFDYNKEVAYSAIEIPLMIRYNSGTMSYVEAGYVISMTKNFTETIDGPYSALAVSNIADQYSSKNGGLILGFGSYVWGKDNFGISAGLRFRYDLDDVLTNASTKVINSPNYGLDSQVTGITKPMSLMLTIEFNYDLGFYMAKSPCNGRRTLLIGNSGGRR